MTVVVLELDVYMCVTKMQKVPSVRHAGGLCVRNKKINLEYWINCDKIQELANSGIPFENCDNANLSHKILLQ